MKSHVSSLAISSLTDSLSLDPDLERLVEAAVARLQDGELLDMELLIEEHPEHADELRRLLPMIASLVELRGAVGDRTEAAAADGRASLPHKELGDFRLICELGHGGMGTVFEAEQLSMGRRVALKVLPFAALVHDKALQRFRNEVRAAAALDHPHIVSVYSVGEDRGVHYYAMQLIRGRTLSELIADVQASQAGGSQFGSARASDDTTRHGQARIRTAMDSRQAAERYRSVARLGIQAAEALQHAHDQGVLHRDVKPSNLMVDAEGQLYVTDFGLARIETDAGMTMTGDLIGTLRYMAPEQALAKRVVIDHRADVYSLGATLYELLTLQPAFGETDRSELLKQIAFEEPILLRKFNRRIPAELETIVLKAMAKNPEERYQAAQQLADDLRAFVEHRPIRAKPPTLFDRIAKWSQRHTAIFWPMAAMLLVVIAILAVSNAQIRKESAAREVALTGKNAALITARKAVDQMLVQVSQERLRDVPSAEQIRRSLMEDALRFYEGFLEQGESDENLRREMAYALSGMSYIQRDLGRHQHALLSIERAIAMWKRLATANPDDIELRENLAKGELQSAYIWSIIEPGPNAEQVDAHYRRAFDIFSDLERDRPDRPQLTGMCQNYFAKVARAEGDNVRAEQLLHECIRRSERYLDYALQTPPLDQMNLEFAERHSEALADVENARVNICWACAELAYWNNGPPERAEEVLHTGLHYAAILLKVNPRLVGARHAHVMLKLYLARVYYATNRAQHADSLLETANHEIHLLCEEFPRERAYWEAANLVHADHVILLNRAGRVEDAAKAWCQIRDWVENLAETIPEEAESRAGLRLCQDHFLTLQRYIDGTGSTDDESTDGLDREANELSVYAPTSNCGQSAITVR